jgi:hypothetical protein
MEREARRYPLAKKTEQSHGLQGMTFGSMDAIINVIGIVVGLGATGSRVAVFLGILVAGIANSFGNAWGFHISEETENIHTRKEVWTSTVMSFGGTFVSTFILIIPMLFLPLQQAIEATVVAGIAMIVLISILVGRIQDLGRKENVRLAMEYVGVSIIVIAVAFVLGQAVAGMLS